MTTARGVAFDFVTVMGGVPGAMIRVPPATPGPVPPLPAISVIPDGRLRSSEGIVLPLVSVRAALMLILSAAQISMFPRVVVMAATAFKFTLRPALNKTLPSVVVIASFTLISRPQHATKFPLTAVIALLIFTSRAEFNVRVVGLPDAVQLIASFMIMSPPGVEENKLVAVLVPDVIVLMVTLFVTSVPDSVEPAMLS